MGLMALAPISLFVYSRAEHTRKVIDALLANAEAKDSELFIFSDAAKDGSMQKKVDKVREYIRTISGFKHIAIIERKENFGLAKSIISGVTEIADRFGKIIVLEDDIVIAPHFLKFMNEALDLYEHEEKVISIHGYIYPTKAKLPETFFMRSADCWGWATWKRGWALFEKDGTKLLRELEKRSLVREFNFDGSYPFSNMLARQIRGENDSWAIRWYASAFLAAKLTLYPGTSLVENIGFDATGTHAKHTTTEYSHKSLLQNPVVLRKLPLAENTAARKTMAHYFRSLQPSIFHKLRWRLMKLMPSSKK